MHTPPFQSDAFFQALMSILAASIVFIVVLCLAAIVLNIIALWIIFKKAGKPGWASLIPFYNTYVLYDITWSSGWYFFLTWIPGFGMVFNYITFARLCKRFHKGDGFTVGMVLLPLVFLCVLAFGKSSYMPLQHPVEAEQTAPAMAQPVETTQAQTELAESTAPEVEPAAPEEETAQPEEGESTQL